MASKKSEDFALALMHANKGPSLKGAKLSAKPKGKAKAMKGKANPFAKGTKHAYG